MHRLYENEDLSVFWDSDKCRHAKMCVTGAPGAFEFGRRPWIDLSKAPAKDIWQAIEKCPSGALSCVYTHDINIILDRENSKSAAFLGDQQIGECDYEITGDKWRIYHTEVSPKHEGKGVAKRLVYKVMEAAEKEGAGIIPSCSYAAKLLG